MSSFKYEAILWISEAVIEAQKTRRLEWLELAMRRLKLTYDNAYLSEAETKDYIRWMELILKEKIT